MSLTKTKAAIVAGLAVALAAAAVSSAGPTARGCTVNGTKGADVLNGTGRADVICGAQGNDTLRGLAGNDTLVGGPGNDVLIGAAGTDIMIGGAGNDAIFAADGRVERISGGGGKDRAIADAGDKVLGVETVKRTGATLAQFNFRGATFTVGSKKFTEQLILGQIAIQALKATGAKVNDQTDLGGTSVNREALLSGKIDMYWEYTGTGWITHLKQTKPIPDSLKQFLAVAKADRANGVKWLDRAPLDNTYAFAVRKEMVKKLGVTKISDFKKLLRTNKKAATLCIGTEFSTRDDGLPGVEKKYGIKFPSENLAKVDEGLIYKLTDEGKVCNFGEVFATDGRIQGLGLFVIKDDKKFFPIYNAALTVRLSVFNKYPKLAPMFKLISKKLTNQAMTKLNAERDIRGRFPEEIAKAWLKQNKFIK